MHRDTPAYTWQRLVGGIDMIARQKRDAVKQTVFQQIWESMKRQVETKLSIMIGVYLLINYTLAYTWQRLVRGIDVIARQKRDAVKQTVLQQE